MERRFSGGPHMPHRVFREGGAPSHITFGSPSFPSSRTERRLAAEPQQPELDNGEPQAYAAGRQLDQPAQLQLSSSWSDDVALFDAGLVSRACRLAVSTSTTTTPSHLGTTAPNSTEICRIAQVKRDRISTPVACKRFGAGLC